MNGTNDNTSGSMIDELKEQGVVLVDRAKSEMKERPYVGIGIGMGIGIPLGVLFGSRALRIAAIGVVGYLVSRLPLRDIADGIRRNLAGPDGAEGKPRRSRGKHG